VLEFTQIVFLL